MGELPVTDWAAREDSAASRVVDFDAFYVVELPRLVGPCPRPLRRRRSPRTSPRRPCSRRTAAGAHVSRARATRPLGTAYVREPRRLPVPPPARRAARPGPAQQPSGGCRRCRRASEEFWAAVRRLPRRQAQAAALRFVYDMPIADIAAALGLHARDRQAAPQPGPARARRRSRRWTRRRSHEPGHRASPPPSRTWNAGRSSTPQPGSCGCGRPTGVARPGGHVALAVVVVLLAAGAGLAARWPTAAAERRLRPRRTCPTACCLAMTATGDHRGRGRRIASAPARGGCRPTATSSGLGDGADLVHDTTSGDAGRPRRGVRRHPGPHGPAPRHASRVPHADTDPHRRRIGGRAPDPVLPTARPRSRYPVSTRGRRSGRPMAPGSPSPRPPASTSSRPTARGCTRYWDPAPGLLACPAVLVTRW